MKGIRGKKIATIRGVQIKLHFSLIFLLIYVVLVATIQFPLVVGSSGHTLETVGGPPLFWGILFALALFISVFLHEFGHVLMAQSMGVHVGGITLMMLGGVSEMEKIPEKRLGEFKMAVVGPVVSFGLAIVLFAIYDLSTVPEISFFSFWISRVNLILGIFNILPIFPLDGGRAFRSVLSLRYGRHRATELAVSVAKFSSWVLGILGFLSFNFLLVLIALFIYSAASSELVISASRDLLKELKVKEIYVQLPALSPHDSLLYAAEVMLRKGQRCLPVELMGEEGGVIYADDLKKVRRDVWSKTIVAQIMRKTPRPLKLEDRLDEELPQLAGAGSLPVALENKVVGLVHYRDIAHFLELQGLSESLSENKTDRAA